MLRVDLTNALPGMKLATAIQHPRRAGSLLLRAGFELDEPAITKLRELGVREAWIAAPGVEFMADFVSPAVMDACHDVAESVSSALSASAAGTHPRIDYSAYKRAVVSLLEKLGENPAARLFLGEILHGADANVRRACNVCFVSILVGLKLDFYLMRERPRLGAIDARDVSNLGVGALLADIAMTRLSEEARVRWDRNRDESCPEFRSHVTIGHEIVRDHLDPSAAAVVLHHHQRYDGTGFPEAEIRGTIRPPSGSDIHVFARVVRAADELESLRIGPDGRRVPTVSALRRLLEPPRRAWIDPIVLRALLSVVPPYAPGTRVRLSDGTEGVVVDWDPEDPCRPTIAELSNDAIVALGGAVIDCATPPVDRRSRASRRIARTHVNLAKNPDLEIVVADGCDVSADNFYPTRDDRYDLRSLARCMSTQDRSVTLGACIAGASRDEP